MIEFRFPSPNITDPKQMQKNMTAFMENWLIEEGIVNYFEWSDKLERAFPGKGKEAVKFFNQIVAAAETSSINYIDMLEDWVCWCLDQNDSLKKALWI